MTPLEITLGIIITIAGLVLVGWLYSNFCISHLDIGHLSEGIVRCIIMFYEQTKNLFSGDYRPATETLI